PLTSTARPMATSEAMQPVNAAPEDQDQRPLSELLAALQLRYVHRSAKTLWLARTLNVALELHVDKCVIHKSEQDTGARFNRRELLWQDVLGAHVLTTTGDHLDLTTLDVAAMAQGEQKFLLGLFACPSKQRSSTSLKKRKLVEWFYQFDAAHAAATVAVAKWINYLADPRTVDVLAQATSLDSLQRVDYPARKFLVIINPVGGSGRGVQTYENKVAPIFKYANIDATLEITTKAAHGTEIVAKMPLNTYDCVLSVGGDGSLCEVFQGLMQREDWNLAVRQPIGIIPGGSGNGLSASVLHQSNEKPKPSNAAFVLAKGKPQEIDITSVRNGKETMYSFLSFEWALIADVDIESEKLRMLGGMRFVVTFGQHLLITRKEYPGTVWYLEDEQGGAEPLRYFDVHDPASTERPGFDLVDNSAENADESKGGKWKEITGNFHILWIMNVTHAAADAFVAPGAKLDDGYNYIMVLHGDHPRKQLIAILTAIENGKHLEETDAQLIRTRAFKLKTDRPDDLLCVDGEVFEGPYVEGQVHRGLGRIITLPPPHTATKPTAEATS
ncbi:TPA: hypothetical protein N0F65_002552, partial [Lagenidium giganteum]